MPASRILIYGDSNTWGWIPQIGDAPTGRYDDHARWPGVLQAALGDGYTVIVDGLCGRTTDISDDEIPLLAGPALDGSATIASTLAANLPLDLVVIMLGTNDLQPKFQRTAAEIAAGVSRIIAIVKSSGGFFGTGMLDYGPPKVLLVCPPRPHSKEGHELVPHYRRVAEETSGSFFDAGSATDLDGVDGVHLSSQAHQAMGLAIAPIVLEILRGMGSADGLASPS